MLISLVRSDSGAACKQKCWKIQAQEAFSSFHTVFHRFLDA